MPIVDEYWEYAREAIIWAAAAKTDEERQSLLGLARTWTLAALEQRQCIPPIVLSFTSAKRDHHVS
jgi:hypothetical protein